MAVIKEIEVTDTPSGGPFPHYPFRTILDSSDKGGGWEGFGGRVRGEGFSGRGP